MDDGRVELEGIDVGETNELAIEQYRAEIERKLVRRQDMVIMPQMVTLYLLAYLDRSNLGNAKLQGLVEDVLNGNDDDYGWAASIFYFGYVMFAIPFTLYGKRFHPSRFMFVCVLGWGVSASAAAGAFNFAGLASSRFCIGLFEAGFAPSAVFYFTLWYTRSEVAFRTSIFVGMAALSGAFGGLIAYGISLIKTHFARWRVLFLVEGLPTIIFAFVILLFLPDRPETANLFSNEEERAVSIERMNRGQASEGHNVLVKRHVVSGFTDWKVHACALVKMGHDAGLATISIFLPNILKSLGYTNTQAQYMTIGPYLVAWVVMLGVCFISDKRRTRGPFLIGATMVSIIGTALIVSFPAEENPQIALVGVFFMVAGIFPCIPLGIQWATDNAGAESKKITAICILVVAGHCWSILASKSFPDREGPDYVRGYSIVLAFLGLSCIMSIVLSVRHRIENARRDKKYGKPNPIMPVDTAEKADKAPMFRYII
ncbi:Major Facilitator Superfamily protein [Coccidioides posadasii C735 delta SOWgp]|uniref:TtuB protein n=3 Tax=Coccidioides posadasii TaxID=199306 RepID=E9DBA9_COCPS|nr:Major Facilitator Superfamily protein [Coccidioides posadasii C735 delta SOWgp]EER27692.1 Major Facilitator Superfamily protein [Coccidioides posadasii C735 delta SOWgp]EFW16061.1 ttuB protein [Coccidioides posadasii str. Silveira]|eukprot:XP_003069837.1 Major Facilitator Superfamily protein [Coccidioides posadasii C735 delta SOWgp]